MGSGWDCEMKDPLGAFTIFLLTSKRGAFSELCCGQKRFIGGNAVVAPVYQGSGTKAGVAPPRYQGTPPRMRQRGRSAVALTSQLSTSHFSMGVALLPLAVVMSVSFLYWLGDHTGHWSSASGIDPFVALRAQRAPRAQGSTTRAATAPR